MDPRFDVLAVHSPDRVDGYATDERLWGGADGHDLLDPGGRECRLVLRGRPHAEEDLPAYGLTLEETTTFTCGRLPDGSKCPSPAARSRCALVARLCSCALLDVSPI